MNGPVKPWAGALGRAAISGHLRQHLDALCIAFLLVVALWVRAEFSFRAPIFLQHDSEGYMLPAYELYAGQGFGVGFRRTPVYPLFLTGTLLVFGENLTGVLIAQHLLGVTTALLTYALGRATFGRLVGFVGGTLVALNGALLIGEHYLMSEGLFIPLLTVSLLLLILAGRNPTARRCLATGLLLALAALCRPIAQALFPLVPLAVLLQGHSLRVALRASVLIGLGVAALLAPWTLRNCLAGSECSTTGVMGQAMLARTAYYDHGFVFYDANDPERGPDAPRPTIRRSIQRASDQGLSGGAIARRLQAEFRWSDAETAKQAREAALDVIRQQPLYYASGTLQIFWQLASSEYEKLRTDWKTLGRRINREDWDEPIAHLLTVSNDGLELDPEQRKAKSEADFERAEQIVNIWQPAHWSPWLPMLALLGLGLALTSRGRARAAAIYGLAALLLMLVAAALDGPVARYRYPADPYLALLAAGGVIGLVRVVCHLLTSMSPLASAWPLGNPALREEPGNSGSKLGTLDHEGA